jgi:ATP-dependent protease Clp ATPase subunit
LLYKALQLPSYAINKVEDLKVNTTQYKITQSAVQRKIMLSYENRPALGQPTPAASDHLPITTPSTTSITNGISTSKSQPETKNSHIWLITGPAGCGKSTVAAYIAKAMNLPYIEGDEVSIHLPIPNPQH